MFFKEIGFPNNRYLAVHLCPCQKEYLRNALLYKIATIAAKEEPAFFLITNPVREALKEWFIELWGSTKQIMEEYDENKITEEEYDILKIFYDAVSKFSLKFIFPRQPEGNPHWNEIVDLARQVVKIFNYKKEERSPYS